MDEESRGELLPPRGRGSRIPIREILRRVDRKIWISERKNERSLRSSDRIKGANGQYDMTPDMTM
ncbi:hypothetical protein RvY_05053 [Ramazzottius varieornatus]|uniref:Uncharacterized protein n=1 Tax=Ramazzottius varieornatus TaxID=947166 RepID=A0A1D1UTR3_RAMVA|nr:hypothetical protein RvY_05053 [Ramazzottius varieornatus]